MMKYLGLVMLSASLLSACSPSATHTPIVNSADKAAQARVSVIVKGTTAKPDPVETRIRALEKTGELTVLRVMESYPLQFEIAGSAAAIVQVQALAAGN